MYAIIQMGGKQYRVQVGDFIEVELLPSNEPGSDLHIRDVLCFSDGSDLQIGAPFVQDFIVSAEIIGVVKGEKVVGLKYKPSHNSCRKWGHRQRYTRLKITAIGSSEKEHAHAHARGGKHGT